MTEREMREGFARGRRLCQEEWSKPEEIALVDKLATEGVCEVTPWEYSDNFQCERRYAVGRGTPGNSPILPYQPPMKTGV